ncbi:MAG: hypothetical protein AMK75_01865 [Planctomycetes bacterium SM23_65]|nr:MAG: hypothetical protein AMK75_01865 [Planctomycetes bacterium SM23_65]
MTAGIIVIVSAVLIFAYVVVSRLRRSARRRALLAAPFPREWEGLPEPLRKELKGRVNVFLAEKNFEGCGGLEMTDEIRVTVAAQACILLLNRKTHYYPRLSSVLVYPAAYVAKGARRLGEHWVEQTDVRAGESWPGGALVLTWDHAKHGAGDLKDGHNVVLHEFAHQLDQEDGHADGIPILEQHSSYVTWARILSKEFQRLRRELRRNRRTLLREYAATNPAEFFAVATEAFFEKPRLLKKKEPELYEELKSYYRLDPVSWRSA